MKKCFLTLCIVVITIASVIGFNGCEVEYLDGNCDTSVDRLSVNSYEDLRIMFTDEILYPKNTIDMKDIMAYSDPIPGGPGDLSKYQTNKGYSIVAMPEIEGVSWVYYASNGVRVYVEAGPFHITGELPYDPTVEGKASNFEILNGIEVVEMQYKSLCSLWLNYNGISITVTAGDKKAVSENGDSLKQYIFAVKEHLDTFVKSK